MSSAFACLWAGALSSVPPRDLKKNTLGLGSDDHRRCDYTNEKTQKHLVHGLSLVMVYSDRMYTTSIWLWCDVFLCAHPGKTNRQTQSLDMHGDMWM